MSFKSIKHTIWSARNIEKMQETSKRIDLFTSRRYNDFSCNTTKILDSILKRKSEPVRTDKIILPDRVLTEKQEVKDHIQSHFRTWTRQNPLDTNPDLIKQWEGVYHSIETIDPNIYQYLMEPIQLEELKSTINNTPKGKATRPLAIANGVLQHLPTPY